MGCRLEMMLHRQACGIGIFSELQELVKWFRPLLHIGACLKIYELVRKKESLRCWVAIGKIYPLDYPKTVLIF
jgi:hypothetical protein